MTLANPEVVTAIGTIAGSLVSLLAMVAAFRAAGSAKDAVAHAAELERGRLERELARVANAVLALAVAVDSLGNQLKIAYRDEFTFAGQSGNEKPFIASVEDKQRGAGTMQNAARELLDAYAKWAGRTNDELAAELIKMDGYAIHLDRVREKFSRDLDRTDANNRIYRERALRF